MEALRTVIGHNVRTVEDQEVLLRESYEFARKHGFAIYDTLYVVLAKKLGAKLLTKDAKQAQLAKRGRSRYCALRYLVRGGIAAVNLVRRVGVYVVLWRSLSTMTRIRKWSG